ncbi:hypothetical protein [Halobacterium wangiae]|uniref:hypothetical protein n=1 Tax=Halobacterium wangiae TaxID=2902623 RepID=UPI001E55D95A|nr:hypothetical protein [Halobacterium wangiae]
MMSLPSIVFGAFTLLLGVYLYLNAAWEFEQSMRLHGVDTDAIEARETQSGVRRNRLGALVVAVFGAGWLAWGLLG